MAAPIVVIDCMRHVYDLTSFDGSIVVSPWIELVYVLVQVDVAYQDDPSRWKASLVVVIWA